MKKVLCIGECCCDIIFGNLPKVPQPGTEVYCETFAIKAGGSANTAMMLAWLGVPVRFLTWIGEDALGRLVREYLENTAVEVVDAKTTKDYKMAVSAVLSTKEDRCFASYGGSEAIAFSDALLEKEIQEVDIVHTFLGYCLQYPIAQLCEKYHKELSLDDSFCGGETILGKECVSHGTKEHVRWLLGKCAYLKFNEEEAKARTGKTDIDKAAEDLGEMVGKDRPGQASAAIVTLGEKGSLIVADGNVHHQPAVILGEFRDACGAGDAYAAGFLAGIAKGMEKKECAKLAAVASGLCVTWYGGTDLSADPNAIWERLYSK